MDFISKITAAARKLQSRPFFFWIAVFTLNSLFFLPEFLLHPDPQQFIPVPGFNPSPGLYESIMLYLRRENLDIFRIAVDFLFILIILTAFCKTRYYRVLCRISLILFLFLLIFQTYDTAMFFIFAKHPVFANDINHILGGLYLIVDISFSKLLGPVLATIGIIALILLIIPFLFNTVVKQLPLFRDKKSWISVCLLAAIITALLTYWFGFYRLKPAIRWISPKVIRNIDESVRITAYKKSLQQGQIDSTYFHYNHHRLNEKPNIYLIMIESYGKILIENPEMTMHYREMMKRHGESLAADNWHTVSGFSEAPISGGISWLSIATVLNGSIIKDQAIYSFLLNGGPKLPNMFRFFNRQGYHTYNLQPMNRPRAGYSFQPYHEMFGYQTPIFFDSLNYLAADFGFGHVPDQFTLFTAHQNYLEKVPDPFFLFFITASSHYPWLNTPVFQSDWRNSAKPEATDPAAANFSERISKTYHFKHQNSRHYKEYLDAIDYEFTFLTDYITNLADENSIFVIMGDHQPPIITGRNHSFQTPIHIISRDSALIHYWQNSGFNKDLFPEPATPTVNHAALYSILLNGLFRHYSSLPAEQLPIPLSTGIELTGN